MSFVQKVLVEAMSNLRPKSTGIAGAVIWVSAGEFEGKSSAHGPRVKVMEVQGGVTPEALLAAASVSIPEGKLLRGELSGVLLADVQAFIKLNADVLLNYWKQDIDTVDMVRSLKKLP